MAIEDEPGRVRYVVQWVGQSPHGTTFIDAEAVGGVAPHGMPVKVRLIFEQHELPYRAGQRFWIDKLD